jgi:hypothetical protein
MKLKTETYNGMKFEFNKETNTQLGDYISYRVTYDKNIILEGITPGTKEEIFESIKKVADERKEEFEKKGFNNYTSLKSPFYYAVWRRTRYGISIERENLSKDEAERVAQEMNNSSYSLVRKGHLSYEVRLQKQKR